MKTFVKVCICSFIFLTAACSADYSHEAESETDGKAFNQSSGYETATHNYDTALSAHDDDKKDNNNGYVHSTAAQVNVDTSKKFIRTVDIKFEVENVSDATYTIEDVVGRFSGYVTKTDLTSHIEHTENIMINPDTTMEQIHYTVNNDMIIRVPNEQLDSCLRNIAKVVAFLDYRVIRADDVTLGLLEKDLAQKRNNQYSKRLKKAVDKQRNKLKDVRTIEKDITDAQWSRDRSYINKLKLNDQIVFSTIKLNIYQDKTVRKKIHLQTQVTTYEPDFKEKLLENLRFGWNILEMLFLFIVRFWSFLLIGVIIYILYVKQIGPFRKR